MDEAEMVAALGALAIAERDRTMPYLNVSIGPFSNYCLISGIQLAMRHPGVNGGPTAGTLTSIRDQLLKAFPEESPVREILALGMDPARDVPTVEMLPTAVPCPECGGHAWHLGDDQTLDCKQCGHTVTMQELVDKMGLAGAVMEAPPLATIPARPGSKTIDFPCPICDGTDWRPMQSSYACDHCLTVFTRETIVGLVDVYLKIYGEHAEGKAANAD
jgi:hypothetical protein